MNLHKPRVLGKTGLLVSRLGVGAGYGIPTNAVEKAYHEYGINYFYWSLPRRAGMKQAIRHLAPTQREKMVIALQSYDHSGLLIERLFDRALRTLQIDYADVLILGCYSSLPRNRVLRVAAKLKERGKARFIAISGHRRPLFGEMAQRADSPIDVFMIRYNAAHRGAETDVFPYLPAENRPGVTTYTATCWAKLLKSSKIPPHEQPLTAAECYRFVLSNPNVDLCLTAPKNQGEMDQALQSLDSGPLSQAEMKRVIRIGDYVYGSR